MDQNHLENRIARLNKVRALLVEARDLVACESDIDELDVALHEARVAVKVCKERTMKTLEWIFGKKVE